MHWARPELLEDRRFGATQFVVLDFEATSPAGGSMEPIEIAMVGLRFADRAVERTFRFEELIKPPPHAPITSFDVGQTGITEAAVADCDAASDVLARADRFVDDVPSVLVAHNVAIEGNILERYREACPCLAALRRIDTIRMSKLVSPGLPSYGLDALVTEYGLPRPAGARHRAMPDVELTVSLLLHLLGIQRRWGQMAALLAEVGGIPESTLGQQQSLF